MKKIEVAKGIVSKGKKHKMIIPCYNNRVLESNIEHEDYGNFVNKVWNPNSKQKKIMDSYEISQLSPSDQADKFNKIQLVFCNQMGLMIDNTVNSVLSKYRQLLESNEEFKSYTESKIPNDSNKSHYRFENNIDRIFGFISLRDIYLYNRELCENGLNTIYDIGCYLTNDQTVVDDNTIVISSLIVNDYILPSIYNTTHTKYPENISRIIVDYYNEFIKELYDALYILFSKAYVLANQYSDYAKYKAVEEYYTLKVDDINNNKETE